MYEIGNDRTWLAGRINRSSYLRVGQSWHFTQPCRTIPGIGATTSRAQITGAYLFAPEWDRIVLRYASINWNAPTVTLTAAVYDAGTDTWSESTFTADGFTPHPAALGLLDSTAGRLMRFPVPAASAFAFFPFAAFRIGVSSGWVTLFPAQTASDAEASDNVWTIYRRRQLAPTTAPTLLSVINPATAADPFTDGGWRSNQGGTVMWAAFDGAVRLNLEGWRGRWNATQSYAVGDRVTNSSEAFYQCTTARVPGDPGPPGTGWTATPNWPIQPSSTFWRATDVPTTHPDFPNLIRIPSSPGHDFTATPAPTIQFAPGVVLSATDDTAHVPAAVTVVFRKAVGLVHSPQPAVSTLTDGQATVAPGEGTGTQPGNRVPICPFIDEEPGDPDAIARIQHSRVRSSRAWSDRPAWSVDPVAWYGRRGGSLGYAGGVQSPSESLTTSIIPMQVGTPQTVTFESFGGVVDQWHAAPLYWNEVDGIVHGALDGMEPYGWHPRTRRLLSLQRLAWSFPDGSWNDFGLGSKAKVIPLAPLAIAPAGTYTMRTLVTDNTGAVPTGEYPDSWLPKIYYDRDLSSAATPDTAWPADLDIAASDRIYVPFRLEAPIVPTPVGRWPAKAHGGGPFNPWENAQFSFFTPATGSGSPYTPSLPSRMDAVIGGFNYNVGDSLDFWWTWSKIVVPLGSLTGGKFYAICGYGLDAYESGIKSPSYQKAITVKIYKMPANSTAYAPYVYNGPNDLGNGPPPGATLLGTKVFTPALKAWQIPPQGNHWGWFPGIELPEFYYTSIQTGNPWESVRYYYWGPGGISDPGAGAPGVDPQWIEDVYPGPGWFSSTIWLSEDVAITDMIAEDTTDDGTKWIYFAVFEYTTEFFSSPGPLSDFAFFGHVIWEPVDRPLPWTVTGRGGAACQGRIRPGTVQGDLGVGS